MTDTNKNLNEKDIYEAFNNMDFDESEFKNIPVEMSEMQKRRLKNNLNKQIKGEKGKKLKIATTAAAVTLCCFIGISMAAPGFAKEIPVLRSIVQTINDKYDIQGEYQKYSQIVNKTVYNNGMGFTINEVLCDDSELIISYTVKSDKKIKGLDIASLFLGNNIKINGKTEHFGGGMQWDYLDDNTLIGVCEIDVERKNMPKKFNIDLNISQIFGVKGKWDTAFTVSRNELMSKTTVFNSNTKVELPNSKIVVEKVMLSPINTSIFIKGDYKDKNKDRYRGNMFDYDYWFVFDDKGNELSQKGSGGGTEGLFSKYDFHYKYDFQSLKNIPKYLTVVPCEITPTIEGGITEDGKAFEKANKEVKKIKKAIDGKYPVELSQGKIGSLIIKEIKNEKDKTLIKYTANGKVPNFQSTYLYIEDEKGERIKSYNEFNRKMDENNSKEFILEVPRLENGKRYFLCTDTLDNYEFKEEYMFKIPLE